MMVGQTRKAWTAGLAAWLGGYVVTGVELYTIDIPGDVEVAIVGIIAALLAWAVPNKT